MSGARRHIAGGGANNRAARPRSGRLIAAAAALTFVIAGVGSLATFGPTAVASAAIERAKSFLQLMQQRSPGFRTKGQLANTKHRIAHRHQRALPKVLIARPLVPFAWPPSAVDIFAPPLPMTTASLEAMPIPFLEENGGPPIILSSPPSGGVIPTPETPVTPPVVPPPQGPAAVPEPGTWAMMLLGLALTGSRIRRALRRQEQAPAH